MDFTFREWLIIVGVTVIVGVLVDGYRRVRSGKRGKLKMSINKSQKFSEGESFDYFNGELPGGSARVVKRSAQKGNAADELISEQNGAIEQQPEPSRQQPADTPAFDVEHELRPDPLFAKETFSYDQPAPWQPGVAGESKNTQDAEDSRETQSTREIEIARETRLAQEAREAQIAREILPAQDAHEAQIDHEALLAQEALEAQIALEAQLARETQPGKDPYEVQIDHEALRAREVPIADEAQLAQEAREAQIAQKVLETQPDQESHEAKIEHEAQLAREALTAQEPQLTQDIQLAQEAKLAGDTQRVSLVDATKIDTAPQPLKPPPRAPLKPGFQGVREVVVINVFCRDKAGFKGADLQHLVEACGMEHGDMNIFHRSEDGKGGDHQFSMANIVKPGTFDLDTMAGISTPGVSFFLSLPGPQDSMKAFEYMLGTAQCLAKNLNGMLKDEMHSVMTGQTIEHSRQKVRDYERRKLSALR